MGADVLTPPLKERLMLKPEPVFVDKNLDKSGLPLEVIKMELK